MLPGNYHGAGRPKTALDVGNNGSSHGRRQKGEHSAGAGAVRCAAAGSGAARVLLGTVSPGGDAVGSGITAKLTGFKAGEDYFSSPRLNS